MSIGQLTEMIGEIRNSCEPMDMELYKQFSIGTMLEKNADTERGTTQR